MPPRPSTPTRRRHARVLALALWPLLMPLDARAAPGSELLGCWSARGIVSHLADGSAQEIRGQACTMDVRAQQIVTTCKLSQGRSYVAEYTYQVVKPGTYRATVTSNSVQPSLVGSARDYHYEVSGDRLRVTTHPPVAKPAPPTAAVRVVSESERVACEK